MTSEWIIMRFGLRDTSVSQARELLQAQKVFDKLESRWDEMIEKDLGK